jgi:hypothetical protein
MPRDDLKLIVYRDIRDFDHRIVNRFACDSDALGWRVFV